MESLITFEDLKKWLGYERRSDIIKKLQEIGVSYTVGKDGKPVTTLQAINQSLINGEENEQTKNEWGFS